MTREQSQFPENTERLTVSDPAVQLARDAGDVPPDGPKPNDAAALTLELDSARHGISLALVRMNELVFATTMMQVRMQLHEDTPATLRGNIAEILAGAKIIEAEARAILASIILSRQLAENLEVRHG